MNKETGGPAFPDGSTNPWGVAEKSGITIRDYFAAKAMQGMYAKHWDMFMDDTYEAPEEAISGAANEAYALADAMLRAREK